MTRRWRALAAIALIAACLAGRAEAAEAPPPGSYSASVATEWFALALQMVQQTPGFSAPVASRALAYLSLALHESIAPGVGAQASLAGQLS